MQSAENMAKINKDRSSLCPVKLDKVGFLNIAGISDSISTMSSRLKGDTIVNAGSLKSPGKAVPTNIFVKCLVILRYLNMMGFMVSLCNTENSATISLLKEDSGQLWINDSKNPTNALNPTSSSRCARTASNRASYKG
jgi:hypothetical protein